MSGMSGPWLYSAVDQARANETCPIQKMGSETRIRSTKSTKPAGFTALNLRASDPPGLVDWLI